MFNELRRFLGTPSYYHSTVHNLCYHDEESSSKLYQTFSSLANLGLFERDGVPQATPYLSDDLIDSIANPYIQHHHVLDLGGSLGTNYWALRHLHPRLLNKVKSWTVIELPELVAVANRNLNEDNLYFVSDLHHLKYPPTIFLCSGVLQYLTHNLLQSYVSFLSSSISVRYLVLDRTLCTNSFNNMSLYECDRTHDPSRWYKLNALSTSYILDLFSSAGYQLLRSGITLGGYTYSSLKKRLAFKSFFYRSLHTPS